MSMINTRQQLHQHIDCLSDDAVNQLAKITLLIISQNQASPQDDDLWRTRWQHLALEQFFREDDDVEYSLADAHKVYHP